MKRALVLIPGLLLLTLIWLPSLWWPLGRDQGVFAAVADVINDGGLPYRDAWDIKPPIIYHLYAFALLPLKWMHFDRLADIQQALSNSDPLQMMMPIRLLDLAMVGATLAFATMLFPPRRRALMGLLIAMPLGVTHFFLGGYWNAALPDSWVALPVMMGLWLWRGWGKRELRRVDFALGLLAGLAFWMKFTAGIYLLLFAGLQARQTWRSNEKPILVIARQWLMLLLGFLTIAWLIVMHYAVRGGLPAMGEVLFRYVFQYAGHASGGHDDLIFSGYNLTRMTMGVGIFVQWYPLLVLPPMLLLLNAALRKRLMQPTIWVGLALAFISVAAQRKFYLNHFNALVIWLAILTALTLERAAWGIRATLAKRGWRPRRTTLVTFVICPLVALMTLASTQLLPQMRIALLTPPFQSPMHGNRVTPHLNGFETGDFRFVEDLVAADVCAKATASDEKIVVWGFEPLIHFLADRRSPSRFLHNQPVVAPLPGGRWPHEFVRDLIADPPALIFVFHSDDQMHVHGVPGESTALFVRLMAQVPELALWFETHYQNIPVDNLVDFQIFVKREEGAE